MKRILAIIPMVICILYAFLPICKIVAAIGGYDFVLNDYPLSMIVLAFISIVAVVSLNILKISLSKTQAIFSALMLPLSAINGLLYIYQSNWKLTIIFVLICCGCSIVMLAKFSSPFILKIVSVVLSMMLIVLLLFVSFVDFIFEDFGSNTVVKSLASPQNTYTVEVIDSDQGGLGGATLVDVNYNNKTVNFFLGRFSKFPLRIYTGKWGEFEKMQISWKDEHNLIINGIKYYLDD